MNELGTQNRVPQAFDGLSEGQLFRGHYCITENVSQHFLEAFSDTHPLHMNDEFARARGFKARVVHGATLHGFLSHFVGVTLGHEDLMLLSSELSFSHPCFLGDRLEFFAKVIRFSAAVRVAELTVEFVRAGDGKKVAQGRIRVRWGNPPVC